MLAQSTGAAVCGNSDAAGIGAVAVVLVILARVIDPALALVLDPALVLVVTLAKAFLPVAALVLALALTAGAGEQAWWALGAVCWLLLQSTFALAKDATDRVQAAIKTKPQRFMFFKECFLPLFTEFKSTLKGQASHSARPNGFRRHGEAPDCLSPQKKKPSRLKCRVVTIA
jgi:hypothetical protein